MDIDHEGQQALDRINALIDKRVKSARRQIFNMFHPAVEHVVASATVIRSVTLTIRDRDQFYRVVNWCNHYAGKGAHRWTVRGRVLRYVDPKKSHYNPPAIKEWIFYVPVDIEALKLYIQ